MKAYIPDSLFHKCWDKKMWENLNLASNQID